MMKAIISTVMGALAMGFFATADAQFFDPADVSAKVGVFLPSDGDAKDSDSVWFAVGLEHKIKDLHYGVANPGFSTSVTVSADWYGKGGYRCVPILLNFVTRADLLYYSVGAGFAFAKTPLLVGTENSTEFAFQATVGMDIMSGVTPMFVEARYHLNGKSELSGFGLYGGVRF